MKNRRNFILCLCLILLTFGALQANEPLVNSSKTVSSAKNDSPDVVGIVKSVFSRIFHRKSKVNMCYWAFIEKVDLSQTEIINGNTQINVSVVANNAENALLLYKYNITAGKIIGEGANVVWDLSGVEAGTYTITAEIDDGCGCLKPYTKEIKVVECADCPPPGFVFSDQPTSWGSTTSSILRRNIREMPPNEVPVIKTFNLSKTELTAKCSTKTLDSENHSSIDIFIDAYDADADTLLYKYTVTAGKIVGDGANVTWDLSGVKPGTYSITVEVDDGCGCVPPVTREIKIVDYAELPR